VALIPWLDEVVPGGWKKAGQAKTSRERVNPSVALRPGKGSKKGIWIATWCMRFLPTQGLGFAERLQRSPVRLLRHTLQ
jgi:hypothetical protein